MILIQVCNYLRHSPWSQDLDTWIVPGQVLTDLAWDYPYTELKAVECIDVGVYTFRTWD